MLLEEKKMADMCLPPLVTFDMLRLPYLEQESKKKS